MKVAAPDITIDNVGDLDALFKELRITEFGNRTAGLLMRQGSGHPDVLIGELWAAIAEQELQNEADI
jgi:hypothetical protein